MVMVLYLTTLSFEEIKILPKASRGKVINSKNWSEKIYLKFYVVTKFFYS